MKDIWYFNFSLPFPLAKDQTFTEFFLFRNLILKIMLAVLNAKITVYENI